jgi:hypothetical protein
MSDYGVMHYYMNRQNYIRQIAILSIKINILKDTDMSPKTKEKQISKMTKRIEKLQKKQEKNENAYLKFRNSSNEKVVKAFVTFKSMEGKLRIMQLYSVSRFYRCFRKPKVIDRYFEKKWLDIRQPAASSLILWENLGVSRKQR